MKMADNKVNKHHFFRYIQYFLLIIYAPSPHPLSTPLYDNEMKVAVTLEFKNLQLHSLHTILAGRGGEGQTTGTANDAIMSHVRTFKRSSKYSK